MNLMSRALARLKMTARFVGGLLAGVAGAGTVAGWLFAVFQWLGVHMDPDSGRFGFADWGAMLVTWTAAEFVGQTLAANVAQSVAVIWFVAATHAAILLFIYYYVPHLALLAGIPLGFVIARRIKDSDLVRIAGTVPAAR